MRKLIVSTFALAIFAGANPVSAQDMGTPFEGAMTVVDLTCKVGMNLTGDDHRMCAQMCADMGLPLGLLDEDGNVYLAAGPGMPAAPQQEVLKPHAEHRVQVKGNVIERDGMKLMIVESVSMD